MVKLGAWWAAVPLVLGGCAFLTFPIYTPHWDPWDYYYDDYWDYYDYDDYWDEGCDGYATLLRWIDYDCGTAAWWFEAETDLWTSAAALSIHQTGVADEVAWDEEHAIPSVDHDTYGCWDRIQVSLPIVESWEDQVADLNTLFECSQPRRDTLTWMIRVWDTDHNMTDCAVWGDDPGEFSEYGCHTWD